jgi:hypothetical protein
MPNLPGRPFQNNDQPQIMGSICYPLPYQPVFSKKFNQYCRNKLCNKLQVFMVTASAPPHYRVVALQSVQSPSDRMPRLEIVKHVLSLIDPIYSDRPTAQDTTYVGLHLAMPHGMCWVSEEELALGVRLS